MTTFVIVIGIVFALMLVKILFFSRSPYRPDNASVGNGNSNDSYNHGYYSH